MYSDCIPVLQIINIFWLDLTLLKGPGLRSGYGTPPDLVIWLLWSTSTKVNQDLPWSALVQGSQSKPRLTLVFHGQRSGYGTPPRFGDLVTLVDVDQSQPGITMVSSGLIIMISWI